MKFVIKKAENGQFYFIVRAKNGQILVTSETYKLKGSAKKAIKSMIRIGSVGTYEIWDNTFFNKRPSCLEKTTA